MMRFRFDLNGTLDCVEWRDDRKTVNLYNNEGLLKDQVTLSEVPTLDVVRDTIIAKKWATSIGDVWLKVGSGDGR